jgi:hypothetical protein
MSSVNNTVWRATLSEEQQEIWKKEETKYLRDLRAKENAMKVKVKLQEWDNDFDVDDDNTLYDKEGTKVGKVVDLENAVLEFFD